MAIIGPNDLPSIIKANSEPMKSYVLKMLGHPNVEVEITEDQFEIIYRNAGDFIAQYFTHEQRLAWFMTKPLQSTYPLPKDAYWVQEVSWDPSLTSPGDVFGINAAFVSQYGSMYSAASSSGLVLDYHLMASYRKFTNKIMGLEGHWELLNEANLPTSVNDNLSASKQLLRLAPTPRGAYPVLVMYIPTVNHFRSPMAKKICYDYILAHAKIMVGHARRKIANMPTPDGGAINLDGDALVTQGQSEIDKAIEQAILLGDQLMVYVW